MELYRDLSVRRRYSWSNIINHRCGCWYYRRSTVCCYICWCIAYWKAVRSWSYPKGCRDSKESIKQVNEALEEFGVAYRALELQIKKERFLGFLWQTGWKITNEEAAKAGYEAAQAMINSMNTSLRSLGSLMAEVVADRATWDDFEVVLGQQLRRIMMEQIMAAAQFEEQAKLLVGMMQESVAGGFTEAEIEAIKQGWRTLMESLETEWERYSSILDDIFPEDEELLVRHEVSGVRITALQGRTGTCSSNCCGRYQSLSNCRDCSIRGWWSCTKTTRLARLRSFMQRDHHGLCYHRAGRVQRTDTESECERRIVGSGNRTKSDADYQRCYDDRQRMEDKGGKLPLIL